ncbi:hypothetical protein EB001_27260, partial [bacterium]|nr:hypothetical protein [bacterium]
QFYRRDKQGFMPEMVEKMFADRKIYKKEMLNAEKAYEEESNKEGGGDKAKKAEIKNRIARYKNLQLSKKVSLNSLYGALGSKYFRFFDIRRDLVDKTINADGDDVDATRIISFLDKICENKIQPVIDNACRDLAEYTNVFQQKIVMKREVLADKAIWTAKKRYILNVHNSEGVQYANPKKKVMGLEMVKSSTPSACREKLREAIDVIFDENETAIQSFIQVFRGEFETLPLADIAFPRGLNGYQKSLI